MKERITNIDIIRICALISMIFFHFWSYQGFNESTTVGIGMFIKTVLRNIGCVCVPLFLMISGYLQSNKKPIWKHIKGLKKIYIIYLFSCVMLIAAEFVFHKGSIDLGEKILGIFSFKLNPYSWYVEMYIGFYLIIPLINIVWDNVDDKRFLFLIMALITILPSTLNIFGVNQDGRFLFSVNANKLVPDYWNALYPITYYYIGRYLRENTNKHLFGKAIYDFMFFIASNLVLSSISFASSYHTEFVWGRWQDYSSVFVVVMSSSLFSLLININFGLLHIKCKNILSLLAEYTYGAYLLSYLADNTIYRLFDRFTRISRYNPFSLFIFVPVIVIFSFVLSAFITSAYKMLFVKAKG